MTDQERDDLRAIQDELLKIADRRGLADNAMCVGTLTVNDLRECIWPKFRPIFLDILRDHGVKHAAA
jgi:hypothetical protein